MNLPRYRHQALGDLMHVVLDPLMRDRVAIAHVRNDSHPEGDEQTVAGIAIWATVPEVVIAEVDAKASGGKPLEKQAVKDAIAHAEAQLAGRGRLVIRPSGTEPVIRVMAEGDDANEVEQVVDTICDAVRKAA